MTSQLHHLLFLFLFLFLTTTTLLLSATTSSAGHGGESCDFIKQSTETFGEAGRIIDISHRITPNMPDFIRTADGLGQFIWLVMTMRNGSLANFSEMKLPTHTGTHVDAPGHFFDHYLDAGFDVDTLDLDVLNGPALLVDVPRDSNITGVSPKL
ncbi:hypothetical protein SOVF_164560 [Spinacia oleracea]|nr:hypothetical protein SOVF_164560 [Spinacia oleracea]